MRSFKSSIFNHFGLKFHSYLGSICVVSSKINALFLKTHCIAYRIRRTWLKVMTLKATTRTKKNSLSKSSIYQFLSWSQDHFSSTLKTSFSLRPRIKLDQTYVKRLNLWKILNVIPQMKISHRSIANKFESRTLINFRHF